MGVGLIQTKTLLADILAAAQGLRDALDAALTENVMLRCELVLRDRQLAIERQRIEDLTEIAWGLMGGDDEYNAVATALAEAGEGGK